MLISSSSKTLNLAKSLFKNINNAYLKFIAVTKTISIIYKESILAISSERLLFNNIIENIRTYGLSAISAIIMTGTFFGGILSLQFFYMLRSVGSQSMLGGAITRAMICDFGPIMVAILIAGHVGASICSQIGSMYVSEQIHALVSMDISPIRHIMAPYLYSAIIYVPILNIIHAISGLISGKFISVHIFNIPKANYINHSFIFLKLSDVILGTIVKPIIFSFIVISIACLNGMSVKNNGIHEVSVLSSKTVTQSFIFIILANLIVIHIHSQYRTFTEGVF